MKRIATLMLSSIAVSMSGLTYAQLAPEEIAKLGGSEYNEVGARLAGNADGSIPPYSGRVQDAGPTPPASAGKFEWGSAYESDKPLYTIDQTNLAQYRELLSAGTAELIERFPTFKVNVYPTNRDKYFSDEVMDNTKSVQLQLGSLKPRMICWMLMPVFPFPSPRTAMRCYGMLFSEIVHPMSCSSSRFTWSTVPADQRYKKKTGC